MDYRQVLQCLGRLLVLLGNIMYFLNIMVSSPVYCDTPRGIPSFQAVNNTEGIPLFCSRSALFCFPLQGLCFHLPKQYTHNIVYQ